MRGRLFTAVLLACATVTALPVALPAPAVDAATNAPPPCPTRDSTGNPLPNSNLYQCKVINKVGHRGSIGLVGDSVLLGSADGVSSPGLPTLLQQSGWGPLEFQASLGMKAYWDLSRYPGDKYRRASASWLVGQWHAGGFHPSVVAVNIGNNHIGQCTRATVSICRKSVEQLLSAIGPSATVWWAKIHMDAAYATVQSPYESTLGWNLALDQAAAAHKNLVLWDWPKALADSNPRIKVDRYGIHPVSSVEYVKRSKLIAADLTLRMPSHFGGAAVTLPVVAPAGLRYLPLRPTTPGSGVVLPPTNIAAGTTRAVSVASAAPQAKAVVLTVTAKGGSSPSRVTVFRCGDPVPTITSVSVAAGAATSAQVISRVSSKGAVCVRTSASAQVTVALQGGFVTPPAGDSMVTSNLVRTSTTKARTTISVPVSADAVAAEINVVSRKGSGRVGLHACDAPAPSTPNLIYSANSTTTAIAFVPTSAAHTICVTVTAASGPTPTVVIDRRFLFTGSATGRLFTPLPPRRLLDTARGVGGWYGPQWPTREVSIPATAAGFRYAAGTITMTGPLSAGVERSHGCGTPLPATLSTAAAAGRSTSATVIAPTASGKLCFAGSTTTHLTFDLLGWWA
jgi:hypothetical protein